MKREKIQYYQFKCQFLTVKQRFSKRHHWSTSPIKQNYTEREIKRSFKSIIMCLVICRLMREIFTSNSQHVFQSRCQLPEIFFWRNYVLIDRIIDTEIDWSSYELPRKQSLTSWSTLKAITLLMNNPTNKKNSSKKKFRNLQFSWKSSDCLHFVSNIYSILYSLVFPWTQNFETLK